jgi:uncharacterized protein YbjT (DUF2867 family)
MMQIKQVCVLGGSGFVGRAIVAQLQTAGYEIKVLTRRRNKAQHLTLLPNVTLLECNVFHDESLRKAIKGSDAVINLIGILHQSRRLSFNHAHHQLPAMLAKICVDLNIPRLIHMSSLGASKQAPSLYLRSKGAGEEALALLNSTLNITVFQPSIIFGRGDRFINLFARLIKLLPVILLAKPMAKFQPVWVEDVAQCVVASIENTRTYGQTYPLAGPTVYTFKALIQLIMDTLGIKRPIIGLSDGLSYAQAFVMECLPVKLMSRDNVKSMSVDSVSDAPFPEVFNIKPTALEAVIPEYLLEKNARGTYDRFRQFAARIRSY